MLALLPACTQERVVSMKGPLVGLPGSSAASAQKVTPGHDPTAIEDGQLRVTLDDGTVELRSRRARHLMVHVYQTLLNDERELFTEQVLSEQTKQEFIDRGMDPGQAFDMLMERRRDVFELFNRLPQGEMTPGVLWKKLGDRTYRLKIQGVRARDLRWNCMDARFEDGNWRLLWFSYES